MSMRASFRRTNFEHVLFYSTSKYVRFFGKIPRSRCLLGTTSFNRRKLIL
jgi:hypothetical protein